MVMYGKESEETAEELARRRRALLVKDRLRREADKSVRRYQSAMATGRFKRAKRIAKAPFRTTGVPILFDKKLPYDPSYIAMKTKDMVDEGGNIRRVAPSGLLKILGAVIGEGKGSHGFIRKLGKFTRFQAFLDALGRIDNVNSPLLDLFGPVQMDKAMRKASPRRKYLMRDGEDGGA